MSEHASDAASTNARSSAPASGQQALTGAERLLWEASERALRQPQDRLALVLHLSRLTPPAPRSYHSRIARVLMQDSAARFDGQVFVMRNKDLVLLCSRHGGASSNPPALPLTSGTVSGREHDDFAANPNSLPRMLGQLFSADADPAKLTSLWDLAHDAPHLLSYLAERASGPALAHAAEEDNDAVLSVAALQGILAKAPLGDLIVQQTGLSLGPDRSKSLADRLAPAFRGLEISLTALNLGNLVARATADPFLFRHLASGLDARLVALLAEDLANQGRLTHAFVRARMPIHVNIGLEAILSPGFAKLLQQAAARGVRLATSISLMQACADLDLLEHARRVLMMTGAELVLTQIDPAALGMIRPAQLRPDLIKVVWSPALAGSSFAEAERRPDGLFAGFRLASIVLQNTDSPQALAWGQAHGISLFQGAFLDQVQAATRMAQCAHAAGCTLRQCGARASSAGITGRAGCMNHGLLDSGLHARAEFAELCS